MSLCYVIDLKTGKLCSRDGYGQGIDSRKLAQNQKWNYALNRDEAPKRLHPSRRTGAFAFADVRGAIAYELGSTPIIHKGCSEPVKRAIKYVREVLFRPAA